MEAVTDEQGAFETERVRAERMVLLAASPLEDLAELLNVGRSGDRLTFELEPVGRASGQIIDEATGQPFAKRRSRYFLRIRQEDKMGAYTGGWREVFGGTTVTDKEGKFKVRGSFRASVIIWPCQSTKRRRVV